MAEQPAEQDLGWRPNKALASLLAFLSPPLSLLYVNRASLSIAYFLVLQFVIPALGLLSRKHFSVSIAFFALYIVIAIIAIFHVRRIAVRSAPILFRPWFTRWYGLIGVLGIAFSIILTIRAFTFEPFRVPAASMFPSIPKDSFVLVQKFGYGNYASYGLRLLRTEIRIPLERGDVMVFEWPRDRAQTFVKRLIGLPGDRIQYKDKLLTVNGSRLPSELLETDGGLELYKESNYEVANTVASPAHDFEVEVGPGQLFFLGDNRDQSNDSRYWGQVPLDHVIGKIVFVLMP